MHRLSELDWLRFETGNVAVLVPEGPAEETPEEPVTRRRTIGAPFDLQVESFPQVLDDARDPDDEDEDDDLDYLYDDDEDDLDDDTDDDLDDFDDEDDDFDDEDDDL